MPTDSESRHLQPISAGSSFDRNNNRIVTCEAKLASRHQTLQNLGLSEVTAAASSLVGKENADLFSKSSPQDIKKLYPEAPSVSVAEVLFADSFLRKVRAAHFGLRAVELGNLTGKYPSNHELWQQYERLQGTTATSIITGKGITFDRHPWKDEFDPEQLHDVVKLEYPEGISVADAFAVNEIEILHFMVESVLQIAVQNGVQISPDRRHFSEDFKKYMEKLVYSSNIFDQLDAALATQAHLFRLDSYPFRRSLAKPLLRHLLSYRVRNQETILPVHEGSYTYQPMHQKLYATVTSAPRVSSKPSQYSSARRGKGVSGNPAKRLGARTSSLQTQQSLVLDTANGSLIDTEFSEIKLAPEIIKQKDMLELKYLDLARPFIGISNSTLRKMGVMGANSVQAVLHEQTKDLDSTQLIRTYVGLHDIANRQENQDTTWVDAYLERINQAYTEYYMYCHENHIPEDLRAVLPRVDTASIMTLRDNWTVVLSAIESTETQLKPELSHIIAEGIGVDKQALCVSPQQAMQLQKRRATGQRMVQDAQPAITQQEADMQVPLRQVNKYMYDLQTGQSAKRTIEDQLRKLFPRQSDLKAAMEQIVRQIPAIFDTSNGPSTGIDKLRDFSNYSVPVYRLKPTAVPGLGEHARVGVAADWRIILTVDPTREDKIGDVRIVAFVKREDLAEAIRQLRR